MTYYILTEYQLRSLLRYEAELCALECAGVDNWQGFEDAIHESPQWDNKECEWDVEEDLKRYNKFDEVKHEQLQ